jgi:replicative DNA helicase
MGTAQRILDHLKNFDLKDEGRGQYRSNSPLRPGSNSHAFTLVIDDEEHGAFDDKARDLSGSLYELADLLSIPKGDERTAIETSKRPYRDMTDYAEAHGIPAEALRKAGWSEVVRNNRPALSFRTNSGTRYRYLDNQKPYYDHDAGTKKCWYGLRRAVEIARKTNSPLIICNGEISTVVAQHYDLPACAITSGEGKIPDHLLTELKSTWDGEIWIGFDCDDTGRKAAEKVRKQIPDARIIDYNLTDGGDLADFCRLYGRDAHAELQKRTVALESRESGISVKDLNHNLSELIRLRKEGSSGGEMDAIISALKKEIHHYERQSQKVEIVTMANLISANSAAVTEAIKNPVEVRGFHSHLPTFDKLIGGFVPSRLHILYGATNMGKSTLAASFASSLIKQAPGLIIPTETPPGSWMNKVVASLTSIPSDRIDEGRLSTQEFNQVMDSYDEIGEKVGGFIKSGSPTVAMVRSAIEEAIDELGIQWVIIDSLSKMKVPGVTDIYETTRIVADGLQDIVYDLGIMIFATCQTGRNAKNRRNKMPQLEDALGAGTVEQNADVVLSIYRHAYYVKLGTAKPDPAFGDHTAMIRILKHRWKNAGDKFVMLHCVEGAGFYEETDAEYGF